MLYYGIILALVAGVFITVQGSINSMVGSAMGVFGTVIIPVWFQAVILTLLLFFNGAFMTQISAFKEKGSMILWLLMTALLGMGIMISITLSFMKIGPLLALSLIVFSQLAISMIIEHYGFFGTSVVPMSLARLGGLVTILIGVFLFSKTR